MAKKRRKLRTGDNDEKPRKIEDPNPESEDYVYDEIDKFHRNKDKILLDPSREDETSEGEVEDEEIFALNEEESDEDSGEEQMEGGDGADESDEELSDDDDVMEVADDDEPDDDKAWGKRKKDFYDADVEDDDIYTSDEEAEAAALEEEQEAMLLQRRMAEKLDHEDFYQADENLLQDSEEKDPEEVVSKDLSKLTKKEKLELLDNAMSMIKNKYWKDLKFNNSEVCVDFINSLSNKAPNDDYAITHKLLSKESPELLPLLDEYRQKMEELKGKYNPFLNICKKGFIKQEKVVKFIEMKHQLLLNYLVNISFYLALKASRDNLQGHPIFDKLVKHRKLLIEMEDLDEKLMETYGDILQDFKDGTLKEGFTELKSKAENMKAKTASVKKKDGFTDEKQDSNILKPKSKKNAETEDIDVDPLAYYNMIKKQKEEKKRQIKEESEKDDAEDENMNDDEKRQITYEMSKNKGLIRKRRKELKNPRVKHKMKFKKAKIRHKSQVPVVQREISRYGGELTGIKSNIARSVKIKS